MTHCISVELKGNIYTKVQQKIVTESKHPPEVKQKYRWWSIEAKLLLRIKALAVWFKPLKFYLKLYRAFLFIIIDTILALYFLLLIIKVMY